jgi:hypothetical protein
LRRFPTERPESSLRIWHQSFTVLDDVPPTGARARPYRPGEARDTAVDLHGLKPQTYPANYPGDDIASASCSACTASQWAANALAAAREGYDAFAMCTMIDPLFREVKNHRRHSGRRRRRALLSPRTL